jgi:hypothetical protein
VPLLQLQTLQWQIWLQHPNSPPPRPLPKRILLMILTPAAFMKIEALSK